MNSLTAYALGFELGTRISGYEIVSMRSFQGGLILSTGSVSVPAINLFYADRGAEVCFYPMPLPEFGDTAAPSWLETPLLIKEILPLGLGRTLIMRGVSQNTWGENREYALRLDFSPGMKALSVFDAASGRLLASYGPAKSGVPASPRERQGAKPYSLLSLPQEYPGPLPDGRNGASGVSGGSAEGWKKSRDTSRALVESIEGLDPALALAYTAKFGPGIEEVWKELAALSARIPEDGFEWRVYDLSDAGTSGRCSLYPVALPFPPRAEHPSGFLESFSLRCEEVTVPAYIATLKRALATAVRRDIKRNRKLHENLSSDLEEASMSKQYRHLGNLLATYRHLLRQGMKEITVREFSGESMVNVPLDPSLNPEKNIALYFRKARKGDKGHLVILNRRIGAEKILRERMEFLKKIESMERLEDIVPLLGTVKKDRPGAKRRGLDEAHSFRSFRIDDRHTVLVGRSDRENDELTHKHAAPTDLWFHAQGSAGSHVILKGANRSTPMSVILVAASIAAWFSRARNSGTVAVAYTEKKYVRKPRGSKPGSAVCQREKTLFVTPRLPEKETPRLPENKRKE